MSKSTMKKLELPIAITMIVVIVALTVIVYALPTSEDWSEVNPLVDFFGLFAADTFLGDLQVSLSDFFTLGTFDDMDEDNMKFTITFNMLGIVTWIVVILLVVGLVYWMRKSASQPAKTQA